MGETFPQTEAPIDSSNVDEERALVQQVSDSVCAQANHLLRLPPMVLEVNLQRL